MKFECIFASDTTPRVIASIRMKGGNLYPFGCVVNANIRPSVSYCGPLSPCGIGYTLAGIGKQTASFVFIQNSNFFRKMPRCEEVCVGTKHSNAPIARRNGAKSISRVSNPDADQSIADVLTELTEAFNAEKNAKNKAYLFILSNGLLDSFADFCRDYHSCDPHRDCVEYLLSKC